MTSDAPPSTFADQVSGFNHPRLASLPAYTRFREALADLIDESDAPLARLLSDIRVSAITSPFGSMCPDCGVTSWPIRGSRRGSHFIGSYRCPGCGTSFRARHDIFAVTWPEGGHITA